MLREHGLTIRSPLGDFDCAAPPCTRTATEPVDAVLLACKAYDLDAAMGAIAPAVGPDTAILPILNGMAHIERLQARFGASHVLGGVAMISAALEADGTIRHFNREHSLAFGELDGSHSARVDAMAASMLGANFNARPGTAIAQKMWEKWTFIAAVAGATCLLRAAIGDIVRAGAVEVSRGLLDECIAIATANGHAPRAAALAPMRSFIEAPDSTVTASLLKDLERHAPSEGEHIIGALLARAGPDLETPLLRLVHAQLRACEIRRVREWSHSESVRG